MNSKTKALLSGEVLTDFAPRESKFYAFATGGTMYRWEGDVFMSRTIVFYYNSKYKIVVAGTVTYRIDGVAAAYSPARFAEHISNAKTETHELCPPEKLAEHMALESFRVMDPEIMKEVNERKGEIK